MKPAKNIINYDQDGREVLIGRYRQSAWGSGAVWVDMGGGVWRYYPSAAVALVSVRRQWPQAYLEA